MPGDTLDLKFTLQYLHSSGANSSETFDLDFTAQACPVGAIINDLGHCQMCTAPDAFLLSEPMRTDSKELFNVRVCHTCEKEIYNCYGGPDIKAKEGYQLLNPGTATFVKCN